MPDQPIITTAPPPQPPPRTLGEMVERAPSREVLVRPRTLLVVAGTALGVALTVWVLLEAWQVVTWIVIAIVLSVALQGALAHGRGRGRPPRPRLGARARRPRPARPSPPGRDR